MAEEVLAFVNPLNGTTFRCVKSQLTKTAGKDPWGKALTVKEAANYGLQVA